ncbi:DUF4450 domain-containing protein [Botryobacter ruber]|uniref:DUF4450 domain-containing protein n=1 Tax=Botryobacter ruber TaxID=2171629 RepID=UPI000E0BB491|nr:DUF4450 domain-containing protein [Botryobacter ruber]
MINKNFGALALAVLVSCQSQHLATQQNSTAAATEKAVAPATTASDYKLDRARPLRYKPEGNSFVIVNGTKRFNRALYGTHSGFRVETGDLPEFLLYMPNKGGNLKLGLATDNGDKWLIKADHIKAIYTPGTMRYEIKDALLGEGQLNIQVLAMADAEGMVVAVESTPNTPAFDLIWTYGGASGHRPSRDGDIGADPESGFYLHPEHTKNNSFTLNKNTFLLDFKIKNNDAQIYGVVPAASTIALADANQQESPKTLLQSGKSELPVVAGKQQVKGQQKLYFAMQNGKSAKPLTYEQIPAAIAKAEAAVQKTASQIRLETPDPYLNTLGGALSIAADGIYDGQSYMHGAIAWRMPLNGWRGAYVADALGWHDRARSNFRGYSEAQVTEPASGPVVPDEERNWARQTEKLGISLYTSGYISRNPGKKHVAHHYDMNMVFIDQMLRHFLWTGDKEYIAEAWPILERHLAWEKRNFDADNDGLYDAYASFWASDGVQYSGGGVTHSSAYHYFSNKTAARLAELLGKNPAPYRLEAEKIKKAIESNMWLSDKGWYAEFKDLLGQRGLHTSAALWTVYHTLDSEVADPFQAYQTLRYVDTQIPKIPIKCSDLPDEKLYTLTTTNWMPYTWSVNNVALAEVVHTALAYWQAGFAEKANQLMKSVLVESMYMGSSPGNLQQLSYYDHYRGELYRDFADGIGMTSRALVEGMFGLVPDMLAGELTVRPGLPSDWNHALLETPDVKYSFRREGSKEIYSIEPRFGKQVKLNFRATALKDKVASVKVNGKSANWSSYAEAIGKPQITITPAVADTYEIEIEWAGNTLAAPKHAAVAANGAAMTVDLGQAEVLDLKDPQQLLASSTKSKNKAEVKLKGEEGHRTFFVQTKQGQLTWWQPVDVELREPFKLVAQPDNGQPQLHFVLQNNTAEDLNKEVTISTGSYSRKLSLNAKAQSASAAVTIPASHLVPGSNRVQVSTGDNVLATADLINWNLPLQAQATKQKFETVDLAEHYNDKVTQIFKNKYLSPRPASATLQLPTQGIGNWCYPLVTAEIDDTGVREKAGTNGGVFALPNGLQFSTAGPGTSNNIIFTSQWDNYPKEVTVPVSGNASHAYFLMAGSTNPMQTRFDNGEVVVTYTDGTTEKLVLRNPETWWPIEQDYVLNNYSFSSSKPKPIRVELKTGNIIGQNYRYSDIKGFAYDSAIPGGAATVLDLPLNPKKELKSVQVRTLANDVVIGLMGMTLVRDTVSAR